MSKVIITCAVAKHPWERQPRESSGDLIFRKSQGLVADTGDRR